MCFQGTVDEMPVEKGCNLALDYACIGKTNIEVMVSVLYSKCRWRRDVTWPWTTLVLARPTLKSW